MLIGKVFQEVEGKEIVIAEGICGGGSHWTPEHPDQSINLYQSSSDYTGIDYEHSNEKRIFFKEYQENGNVWEVTYDSREGIDRMVAYELPNWFSNVNVPIPKHHVEYKDGDVEVNHIGYYQQDLTSC